MNTFATLVKIVLSLCTLLQITTAFAQPDFVPRDPLDLPFSPKVKFVDNDG